MYIYIYTHSSRRGATSSTWRPTATTRADIKYIIQVKIPNRCINRMVLLVNVWYGVSFPNARVQRDGALRAVHGGNDCD